MRRGLPAAAALLALTGLAAHGGVPVIDAPHAYYYHEMYLPQLTAGPSGVAWSPDSTEVVYSAGGSLWRQRLDSSLAVQLTDGPGYDYQPDWSPDGRSIVYASNRDNAIELYRLDLASAKSEPLTHGGSVNVEPRFSPDGRKLVFVSTAFNKRFHLFVGTLAAGVLTDVARITGENRSPLPRYYYSPFDHEINPAWAPDGKSILYISNRGRIHGTGGFWRVAAVPGATPQELHYEETNWRARPDFAPDGHRIVYSSYLGRNWLQLWVMAGDGGEPFPLSYGEWDDTAPRWSPDGAHIAFISNRNGYTDLRILDFPGGATRTLAAAELRRLHPYGRLHVKLVDEQGAAISARVSVTDRDGRFHAPPTAWIQAADFDRDEHPFDAMYFHADGEATLDVPAGEVQVDVVKGPERVPVRERVTVAAGSTAEFTAKLPARPWMDGSGRRWVSGDVHVHMNYAGTYRNTPANLALQASAEDLALVNDLIVNKEQRIPDIAYAGKGLDPASRADALVLHGQEFHTSYWGHLGLPGLQDHLLLPGYAGYPNTAAASLYPSNAVVADMAHAQGALVGYAHPFEEEPTPLTHPVHTDADELPVDVALGKVDYLEVMGFSDHQATAGVWYRLLNLGFRLPAAGGTDAMADYAMLRGPVGMNRTYVSLPDGPLDYRAWLAGLKAGRSFATNGPLLEFTLGGKPVGDTLALRAGQPVAFSAHVRSIVPLDVAQVVCNGKVVQGLALDGTRQEAASSGTLPVGASGWCLLRAFTRKAEYPVLDNFVYATTSPVYVRVNGQAPRSPADARFFIAWIRHLAQATAAYPDWNSEKEKSAVLRTLADAQQVYQRLQ
ncbi:MAG: CehA/McbA family metallohydrolase [Proteobacteria bacterium]|nr:CehA/McbA family metallohydrolase [Pseudomonadota bacterium]